MKLQSLLTDNTLLLCSKPLTGSYVQIKNGACYDKSGPLSKCLGYDKVHNKTK